MSKRIYSAVAAVLVAVFAIIATIRTSNGDLYDPPTQGKNNTILFVVLPHPGLSNPLPKHSGTPSSNRDTFASYPTSFEDRLKRISDSTLGQSSTVKPITFHRLPGREYDDIVEERLGSGPEILVSPPGVAGIGKFCRDVQFLLSPWPAKEHFELYSEITNLIASIDPAVVVLDSVFGPAIDAARENNRLHAIISPNTIVDIFSALQPRGGMFWKYPIMGSGLTFPIPWRYIPSNIYQVIRFVSRMLYTPEIAEKRKFLADQGLRNPIDFFHLHHEDAPWITQTMIGASIPVEVIPKNVSAVGPIVVSVAPVEEQDPELSTWLGRAPTVLFNLGSGFAYTEERATIMGAAIKQVLDHTHVQVLWKLARSGEYSDNFGLSLQDYISNGRLRIEKWLTVDPTSILVSGHIVAFVHHGGAKGYHEGIIGGVPQIVLPLWIDLYNFAALVETLEIGVWACPGISPHWTPDCIAEAVLNVICESDGSRAMREKTQHLGEVAKSLSGRYGAAAIIAQLASSGYQM